MDGLMSLLVSYFDKIYGQTGLKTLIIQYQCLTI